MAMLNYQRDRVHGHFLCRKLFTKPPGCWGSLKRSFFHVRFAKGGPLELAVDVEHLVPILIHGW